jgi:hypothetical protein
MKLVPIVSVFSHWDHHWYMWLPGDPIYEAVEIMSRDRGEGTPPLVWVFFTERDGPKRQVHYFNDARVAAAAGGQFRHIAYAIAGAQGRPRSVSVELTDEQKRPVAINVQCAPDAQLVIAGAGLTNQIGHSADRLLLIFFREKNGFALSWQVTIAGVDVARSQPGRDRPVPFPAAYSSNIFVAGFPFVDRQVTFDAAVPVAQNVARFAPAGSPGSFAAKLADGSQLELAAAADGQIQHYRHRDGSHVLEISFVPSLPSPDQLTADVDAAFRISLDGFRDLVAGTVKVTQRDNSVVLDWRFDTPDWTRAHPLRTTAVLESSNNAHIAVRPAAAR